MQAVVLVFIALTCTTALAEPTDSLFERLHSLSAYSRGTQRKTQGAGHNGRQPCACIHYSMCGPGHIVSFYYNCAGHLNVCCSKQDILPPLPPMPIPALPLLPPSPSLPPSSPPSQSSSASPVRCGARNPEGVGVGRTAKSGNQAEFGEFPWMALVFREVEQNSTKRIMYQCGGALIQPDVVITAAHCVNKDGQFKVRLGEWNTQSDEERFPHQDRGVKTVTKHPEFKEETFLNDIAILVLEKPVNITENVDILCLPKQDMVPDDSKCFVSGWGKDSQDGEYQAILKKLELPIVSSDSCQKSLRKTRLGKDFKLHDSFICAGGVSDRDTCTGDGGSPLVCPIPGTVGRYFQAGIVSWGVGCGGEHIPVVYTNVAKYFDWINNSLSQQNVSYSYYHQDHAYQIDKHIPQENANVSYYHHHADDRIDQPLPHLHGNISYSQHHDLDRFDKHIAEQNFNSSGYKFNNSWQYSYDYTY